MFQALQPNLVNNQYDDDDDDDDDDEDADDGDDDDDDDDDYDDDDDLSVRRLSSARNAKLEIVLSFDSRSYLYCIEF